MKKICNWITGAVFLTFWLSLLSIDSDTMVPLVLLILSWLYLAVVAWRKGWIYNPERDEVE